MFCFRFEKVPLITPNGDVLVKELNFEVRHEELFYNGNWRKPFYS